MAGFDFLGAGFLGLFNHRMVTECIALWVSNFLDTSGVLIRIQRSFFMGGCYCRCRLFAAGRFCDAYHRLSMIS
ncbi:uncharacterized protein BO72DRAFT_22820 [Aspergillus fijiensis CBS 313.89]|uniref:Uncharacterized protein n=1 Tax=Aspergillus fijiensis CBS 313.89 TaxID=1448319 RepID=A0A8G1W1X4_9EURO|nr:uncharacterized protein BO72DRAFT_22820 [Aspergillus fijiensis CBS 313.89]RAK79861.1 hypothetical protein BO72DRAFT_22820 [Aspergillus fijiensis CBS 313.89]